MLCILLKHKALIILTFRKISLGLGIEYCGLTQAPVRYLLGIQRAVLLRFEAKYGLDENNGHISAISTGTDLTERGFMSKLNYF